MIVCTIFSAGFATSHWRTCSPPRREFLQPDLGYNRARGGRIFATPGTPIFPQSPLASQLNISPRGSRACPHCDLKQSPDPSRQQPMTNNPVLFDHQKIPYTKRVEWGKKKAWHSIHRAASLHAHMCV